ncbi:brain tumor protein-like [Bacillus rossius redtenbacheri]|uniref:brain tumor protein-like n=1 Tax=Bacillus rossius redtenbacheri TaxID=93214 RepID=UPI002FDD773F
MESPALSLDSLPRANSFGSVVDHAELDSTSPLSLNSSSPSSSHGHDALKCTVCGETRANVKLLSCFHTVCVSCLDKRGGSQFSCPACKEETACKKAAEFPWCTGCKSRSTGAVARCFDCDNFLCAKCMMAHQYMHCFEGHRVHSLGDAQPQNGKDDTKPGGEKVVVCSRHKGEQVKYFCRSCNVPICKECTADHPSGMHDYDRLSDVGPKQLEVMMQTLQETRSKATDIRNSLKNLEHTSSRLQVQYHKAQNEINETFQFYRSMIEERKQELLKELESVFSAKQISLNVVGQKAQETMEKIYGTCDFFERIIKHTSMVETLMCKRLFDTKLQAFMNYNPESSLQAGCDLEFVSNYQAIQVGVRNTFGYVRSSSSELQVGPSKQPPIARPVNSSVHLNGSSIGLNGTALHGSVNGTGLNGGCVNGGGLNGVLERPYSNGLLSSSSTSSSPFESNIISKRFSSANSLGPFSTAVSDLSLNGMNPYEKWSNGGGESIFQNGSGDHYSFSSSTTADSMLDLTSKLMSTAIFPPKSQIKRQKMIYHCKFGEFGVMEGQFTEPSGVAVNAQNDIIVADTNNHRIQIFDKEGRFKFQFGECGKRDGQLLYPNRVAVVRTSGDIIVTERSPTHQIQIYNQYGQFVRKFGANILQHPRGVTVDSKGRIVVVECKVMRVIIFDQSGNVLQKFGCSKHLEFPNGVVVNDKQEIFISDNRAHCVKVFNYEGTYLRQIGGEGITNYPIGVGINSAGEILIADNHNNFNLTIFTQDGQLVSALESKVKHAQCFDVALMDDGSVVLASKDYRLYIYRYVQVPPIGL